MLSIFAILGPPKNGRDARDMPSIRFHGFNLQAWDLIDVPSRELSSTYGVMYSEFFSYWIFCQTGQYSFGMAWTMLFVGCISHGLDSSGDGVLYGDHG